MTRTEAIRHLRANPRAEAERLVWDALIAAAEAREIATQPPAIDATSVNGHRRDDADRALHRFDTAVERMRIIANESRKTNDGNNASAAGAAAQGEAGDRGLRVPERIHTQH